VIVNVWIGLRDDAQAAILTRLRWDEETQGPYTGPVTDRQHKLFSYMHDRENTQRLFKQATFGGRVWTVWSVYFDLPGNILQLVKAELDQMLVDYPTQFVVMGAWHWEGNQVGTEHVYSTRIVTKTWSILNPDYQPDPDLPAFDDRYTIRVTGDVEEEYVSGHTGTPIYPMHPQILKFMPDVDGLPATVVTDVNLGQGQVHRNFL